MRFAFFFSENYEFGYDFSRWAELQNLVLWWKKAIAVLWIAVGFCKTYNFQSNVLISLPPPASSTCSIASKIPDSLRLRCSFWKAVWIKKLKENWKNGFPWNRFPTVKCNFMSTTYERLKIWMNIEILFP